MYKRSGWNWVDVGLMARVELGTVEDGTYHSEFGHLTSVPEDNPDYGSSSATVRLFDGSDATVPMRNVSPIRDAERDLVAGVEHGASGFTDDPALNDKQWYALGLLYRLANEMWRPGRADPTIGRGTGGVVKSTVTVLVKHGLAVLWSEYELKRYPEGMEKRPIPSELNWYAEITALGRRAWEKHAAPAEQTPSEKRPGYTKVPGLDRWVKDREDEQAAPTPKRRRAKVEMTREGIPTGRYAVDIPGWGTQFFWIKLEGRDPALRYTVVRRLEDDGKWRAYYGGIREVYRLIKQAGWEAASRFGENKNVCAICGRPLTVSAIKGIGPECEQEVGENPFGPNN